MAEDIEDEALDPRVQIQLEKLNTCTDEINRLEVELDEANSAFRSILSESSHRLRLLGKKLGKAIEAARPYYEAREHAHKAQLECQRAAVQYQRASEIHQAARETISLAEQRFLSKQNEWEFDTAWQEMLNHATMKVMEAEAMRLESETEHKRRAASFTEAEQQVHMMEAKLKRDIVKSRIYFETKSTFQKKLQEIKSQVETLRKAVLNSKKAYTDALHSLEMISTEIHEKRKLRYPREPGVGAELVSSSTSSSAVDVGSSCPGGDPLRAPVLEASVASHHYPPVTTVSRLFNVDIGSHAESETYGSLDGGSLSVSSAGSPSAGSTLSLPADLSKSKLEDITLGLNALSPKDTWAEQCAINLGFGDTKDTKFDSKDSVKKLCEEFEDVDLND